MSAQAAAKTKLSVTIVYNGVPQVFEYVGNQAINAIRAKALNVFGISGEGRENIRLFGPDNQTELPDNAAMEDHVQPDSTLILRPRTSGGGYAC